jgi:hypothetical protein
MDAERMLSAGSSLDKARAIFTDLARKRPRARLTIRQRIRVLNGGHEAWRMASNIAKAAGAAETAQHWPWPQKTKLNRYYASQNGLQVSLNASCGVRPISDRSRSLSFIRSWRHRARWRHSMNNARSSLHTGRRRERTVIMLRPIMLMASSNARR